MGEDLTDRAAGASWLHIGRRRGFLLATSVLFGLAAPALGQTLPKGGQYVAGSGGIATAGAAMTITQSTARGIINWQGFSIGAANQVQFNNGAGATLNRVTGGNLSTIAGELGATGSVYLINPNGVVVGPDGKVLTGGSFVASTRDVPNGQFMAGGTLAFSGTSNGAVTNAGSITSQNGDVVLIGQAASNRGTITAPNGTVALAAGNQVLLSPASGPAGIYVAPDVTATGDASNSGTIKAAAAALASAGGNVYALAGNRGGLIQATGSQTIAGQVWLTAPNGTVNVSGTVTATNADGSGGTIVADGHGVALGATARVSASGSSGGTVLVGIAPGGQSEAATTTIASGAQILATGVGTAGGHIETSGQSLSLGSATIDAGLGGSWVIDPVDLTINTAAAGAIDGSLNAGTSVIEETTATGASGFGTKSSGPGDINVDAAITWNSSAVLTLSAFHSVNVNTAITATGNGTLDIVTNNNVDGTSSGGTFNIAMGKGHIQFTTPGEGALNINGDPYTLIWTVPELQAVGGGGHYALAKNLDASSTSTTPFTPIAEAGFFGTFNGLGNSISKLTINDTTDPYVGLFGQVTSGVVENIGLMRVSVTGTASVPDLYVGGLVGWNNGGRITNAYATGGVTGSGESSNDVGGLVGRSSGPITDAYATGMVTGTVTGSPASSDVGGLVGFNGATITDAYATVVVTGTVTGNPASSNVGGLVGQNLGLITDAHATGVVTGVATGAEESSYVGGLVGGNGGTITDAYATGAVTATSALMASGIGGLVGGNGGTITDAYATGAVTGTSAGGAGGIGGLAGDNAGSGTISDSYATGAVTSTSAGSNIGGLVGQNLGTITNAFATGAVTDKAFGGYVGGLVGWNNGSTSTISGSYATGAVNGGGGNENEVGGLVGQNDGSITDAHATGKVTGGSGSDAYAGGLVGENIDTTTISDSYATGAVSGGDSSEVGGLVGYNYAGPISSSYATGAVTGGSYDGKTTCSCVGGLVGLNYNGTISGSYATGAVTGGSGSDVGGLVGYNTYYGSITDAHATGKVTGGSDSDVGGLVGYNDVDGTISNSFVIGVVSGGDSSDVGGLVGYNDGAISGSFAIGLASGGKDSAVGGLVGYNDVAGVISGSFAIELVSGGSGSTVGWLVGVNHGKITP